MQKSTGGMGQDDSWSQLWEKKGRKVKEEPGPKWKISNQNAIKACTA